MTNIDFGRGYAVGLATRESVFQLREERDRLQAENADLLAALQAILAEVSGEYDGWAKDAVSVLSIREIAKAAIARATGEQKGATK